MSRRAPKPSGNMPDPRQQHCSGCSIWRRCRIGGHPGRGGVGYLAGRHQHLRPSAVDRSHGCEGLGVTHVEYVRDGRPTCRNRYVRYRRTDDGDAGRRTHAESRQAGTIRGRGLTSRGPWPQGLTPCFDRAAQGDPLFSVSMGNVMTAHRRWIDAPDGFAPAFFSSAYQDGRRPLSRRGCADDGRTLPQHADSSVSAEGDMQAGTVWRGTGPRRRCRRRRGHGFQVRVSADQLPVRRSAVRLRLLLQQSRPEQADQRRRLQSRPRRRRRQGPVGRRCGQSPQRAGFVPREGVTAEGDGWVLTMWWDPTTAAEVILLDAQGFTAAPVVRVRFPHRVPLGFRGSWAPVAELDAAVRRSRPARR
ncbi:carotenoid oxygenase family protein [Streptomyces sp. NPDC096057]|uniref:carotenoid oxygenase family protein n=1 Tax=Streptomyces sp. NPDC096057 TaxID=3155543 RepID=UPI003317720B